MVHGAKRLPPEGGMFGLQLEVAGLRLKPPQAGPA